MNTYRLTLKTLSPFGTPLVGDTLFGQLCWAVIDQYGELQLSEWLDGYTEGKPFLVISDAMPHNYLPMPTLPSYFWQIEPKEQDRKQLRKRTWVSIETVRQQITSTWQIYAKSEEDILEKKIKNQPHNTLSRKSNTTETGEFSPYVMPQIWYRNETKLDLYIVFDETRIKLKQIQDLLNQIGQLGFGRDISIGLGKFDVMQYQECNLKFIKNPNTYLTLANAAPQNLGLNISKSYYQITTRFGRHGNIQALSNNPFKKPIILAKPGAIFTPNQWQPKDFLGNGLGDISYVQPKAVHQGYAPVISIAVDFPEG